MRAIGIAAGVLVVAGAIGVGVVKSMAAGADAERAGTLFLATLRKGDVDGAYAQLSAARRAVMTRDAFAKLTDHTAFRRHETVALRPPKEWSPGLCSYGSISVDGKEWAAELFFVEEAEGRWNVQSFAIQPPAPSALGVLLEECGYGAETRAGYAGPSIDRTTSPVPR